MTARVLLCAMAVELGLFFVVPKAPAATRAPRRAQHERHVPAVDVQWLSNAAASQLIDAEGRPGPLFEQVFLGGPSPPPEARERIAAFARANHVSIDLDVEDDSLVAIRLDVTYGGCCGYEGADVLALRLRRAAIGSSCQGYPYWWPNDWTFSVGDVHARVAARVSRITVRWEELWSPAEVLERAHSLLGKRVAEVRAAHRDHWVEAEHGERYLLEVPGPSQEISEVVQKPVAERADLGLLIKAKRGRIVEVAYLDGYADLVTIPKR